jgi:uncharacterized membrane protein
MKPIVLPLAAACALLSACQGGASDSSAAGETAAPTQADAAVPGDTDETAPYSGIAADEVLRFTGTEPFWGGEVSGKTLTYSTPEDQDGTAIAVERFAGRGGIAFSGLLDGADFEMTVTPLECSDGMSDRTYPFTVTLEIGEDRRSGCAWSEQHPFEGPEHP